ncbi:hypothetical protein R1sor_025465 [Riccia sorocarpa]|uniref:Reverse transcriptase domain-containing protein n=1 Tax=Riccia sorocarpa TaxID=122646 RepID=A0ABD3GBF9_9MARC
MDSHEASINFARVRISSWNFGGLASFHRRIGVKAFLRKFRPHILALQETHISADRLEFLISTFTSEYKVLAADARGHSGGVAFLSHNTCIVHEWKAIDHRRIWGIFEINKCRVPLINEYALVEPAGRGDFWDDLISSLPSRKFLFTGDWNVIKDPADSSSKSNWLTRQETVNFLNFKQMFALQDIRRCGCAQESPRFTRVQRRQDILTWSTLDRFYSLVSLLGTFQLRLLHHPEFPLSDHLPISLWFSGLPNQAPPQPVSLFFKADPCILQKQEIRDKMEVVWQRHRGAGSLSSPQNYFKAWMEIRAIAKEKQYRESQQLSSLDKMRKRLLELSNKPPNGDPHSPEILALTEEVRKLQAIHDHTHRLWSREKFILLGETNSAYYLRRFKQRAARGTIKTLMLDDGSVIRSQTNITREVHRFFSDIYSKPIKDQHTVRKRDKLLQILRPSLSSGENLFLSEVPSHREFSDILRAMPSGKAPVIDCFGNDWRPIVLLTAHYKLLAKVIATRLVVILPKVVPPQQQGFIKGRGVHGCVLNLLLAHESLRRTRRNVAFVMLDLEKAYDKLSSIQPVKLPGGVTFDVTALADDTALFLALHEPTFHVFFRLLESFQAASRVKVNLRKSKIMVVGKYSQPPSWLLQQPIQVLGKSQSTRSVLWGRMKEGKLKAPLVGWDLLSALTTCGGLGIWDLQNFNSAFLTKYVGSLVSNPLDATWPPVFWTLCKDKFRRPPEEFLLLGRLPLASMSPCP